MLERLASRTGPFSARLLSITLLVASSVALPSAAKAEEAAVQGGPGGHYFEYGCGPGRVLVGLRGSAGILLDSVQAICAAVDARGLTIDSGLQGPVIGGDRPMDKWVECPVGYAVTHAVIGLNDDHPQVGAIRIICTELVNRRAGGSREFMLAGSGNLEGYSSPQLLSSSRPGTPNQWSECQSGYAVGIHGRADRYINAFGLLCGPRPAATIPENTAGRTLGKRKRPPSAIGERRPGDSTITSIPGLAEPPRTLGKRKRAAPSGGAGSESNPMAGQPAEIDPALGASLNSDGGLPASPPAAAAEPPSPLINGSYSTTVTVTDSRCFTQDLRGTWRGVAELQPQPDIMIPLQNFTPLFAAPIVIQVQGLVIRQSTPIQLNAGAVSGSVPATFDGAFRNDGGEFNVRFTAGTSLCRIRGTILGERI